MSEINAPLGKTLSYDRDFEGKLTSFNDARNNSSTWTYDQDNLLAKLEYPDGQSVEYTYDQDRLLKTKVINANMKETYSYDSAGRLTEIDFLRAGEQDQSFTYRYDDVVESVSDEAGITSYEYYDNYLIKSVTYDYTRSLLANVQRLDYEYYPDNLLKKLRKRWTRTCAARRAAEIKKVMARREV